MIVIESFLGQLGNQMFQVASVIGILRKLGLPDPPRALVGNRLGIYGADHMFKGDIEYVDTSDNMIDGMRVADNIDKRISISSESPTSFMTSPTDFSYLNKGTNYQILAQLMDEHYFIDVKDEIIDFFTFDYEKLGPYNDVVSSINKHEETCSVHIRLVDYVTNQRCKDVMFHQLAHEQTYYQDAIDEIGRDKTFLIFSDDIHTCATDPAIVDIFKDVKHIYVKHTHPGVMTCADMYLMTQCHNNIIANSTYSWWGAWLNVNDNKVICPKKWFRKRAGIENSSESGQPFNGAIHI